MHVRVRAVRDLRFTRQDYGHEKVQERNQGGSLSALVKAAATHVCRLKRNQRKKKFDPEPRGVVPKILIFLKPIRRLEPEYLVRDEYR